MKDYPFPSASNIILPSVPSIDIVEEMYEAHNTDLDRDKEIVLCDECGKPFAAGELFIGACSSCWEK